MNRIVNVMKMQLVNRQTYIGMPLIILSGSFLLAMFIFLLIPSGEMKFAGGASVAPLWYFTVVGVQALTMTFPFSQAMSITRRDFHLGTLLTAAITAAMLALIYFTFSLIESATGGWGLNGYFTIPGLKGNELLSAGLTYFVVAMLFFLTGYWSTAVFKRWGAVVLTTILTGVAILLTLALLLSIRAGTFDAIVQWFVTQGLLGMSLWGLLLAAVLAAGSYLMVRRVAL